MASQLEHRIDALAAIATDICSADSHAGIEKESLRVLPSGNLSQAPHPVGLGSALTHPLITTDFCESQPELITGVHHHVQGLSRGTERHPPVRLSLARRRVAVVVEHAVHARSDDQVPIAQYGTVERRPYQADLPPRTGRALRPSDADDLRHPLQLLDCRTSCGRSSPRFAARTTPRISRRRVFRSDSKLPPPLVAADLPVRRVAVVVQVVRQRQTAHISTVSTKVRCTCRTGTSLRMGGLGYTAMPRPNLHISYNSLAEYARSLLDALTRAVPAVRANRREGRRRVPATVDDAAADRERVLRDHPAQAQRSTTNERPIDRADRHRASSTSKCVAST